MSAFYCVPILCAQVGPISVPSSTDPCSQLLLTEPAQPKPTYSQHSRHLEKGACPMGFLGEALKGDGKRPSQKASTPGLRHQPFPGIGRIPWGFK